MYVHLEVASFVKLHGGAVKTTSFMLSVMPQRPILSHEKA